MPVAAILAVLVGVPIILLLVLRSNAAVVFLALCAGLVLQIYIGEDAALLLAMITPESGPAARQVLNGTLILLPPLATAIMLRKKAKGLKLILNLIPAAAVGGLTVMAIVPHISPITNQKILESAYWRYLEDAQVLIVGLGVLSSLLLIKPSRKKDDDKKKKHHK